LGRQGRLIIVIIIIRIRILRITKLEIGMIPARK